MTRSYAVCNIFMYINMVCLYANEQKKKTTVYIIQFSVNYYTFFFFFFVNGDENGFAVSHIKIL